MKSSVHKGKCCAHAGQWERFWIKATERNEKLFDRYYELCEERDALKKELAELKPRLRKTEEELMGARRIIYGNDNRARCE